MAPSKELIPVSRRTVLPRVIAERLPAIPELRERLPGRFRDWFTAVPEDYFAHGEEGLYTTRRHWMVPLKDIVAVKRAGIMPIAFAALFVLGWMTPGVWWILILKFLIAMSHMVYMVYCIASWRLDIVVSTDRQLIHLDGVFIRRVEAIELDRIKKRWIEQTIPGRVFGYGTVQVTTSDDSAERLGALDFIPDPRRLYRATL